MIKKMDLVNLLQKIISGYNFFIAIVGTFANLLTCHICLRKKLKRFTTFKLYAFNSVSDMIGLYQWNIFQFVLYNFHVNLQHNLWYCYMCSYLQITTFEISAWLLVKYLFLFYHHF